MARYEFDPTQDTAGFPIFPGGDYRFKVGEPKAFKGETKEGANKGQVNFGVAFPVTAVGGPVDSNGNMSPKEHIGKKAYQRLYYHTQESRNFSKGIILSIFGYSPKEEELFNQQLIKIKENDPENPAVDWSFDPDTGEVGHAWRGIVNAEFVATLGVQKRKNNVTGLEEEQQTWEQTRPAPTNDSPVSTPTSETVTTENVAEVPASA